jgi:hypothetical protein
MRKSFDYAYTFMTGYLGLSLLSSIQNAIAARNSAINQA